MKLPNRERAYIPPKKLTGYLLSETHPVGESKARVLRAAGFDDASADALAREFIRVAQSHDVASVTESPFGTKYAIDGMVTSPLGKTVTVRTVWIVEPSSDGPRFVTAYPK